MRKAVRTLLVVVALGGLLFLFILPGRTWLEQRRAMSRAEHQLQVLNAENAALTRKAAQLQTPAYVQQIARQEYGLVLPGQRSFGIIPATATTTTSVPAPPSG
ncbi:MAG TPA: septum formation initiator family protein [Acidimicrobiales bacterium]|nr:septum formation initiator family protein [Acidimicrobiales bacterium]